MFFSLLPTEFFLHIIPCNDKREAVLGSAFCFLPLHPGCSVTIRGCCWQVDEYFNSNNGIFSTLGDTGVHIPWLSLLSWHLQRLPGHVSKRFQHDLTGHWERIFPKLLQDSMRFREILLAKTTYFHQVLRGCTGRNWVGSTFVSRLISSLYLVSGLFFQTTADGEGIFCLL